MAEAEDTRVATGTNETRWFRQGSHGALERPRSSATTTAGEVKCKAEFSNYTKITSD